MKRIVLSFCIALLVLISAPDLLEAQQQGLPVDGRDFYLGLVMPSFYKNPPQIQDGDFHGFSGWYVLISSYTDNTAIISYFDGSGKEVPATTVQILAQQGKAIPISLSNMKLSDTAGDVPEFKAMHITSRKPINVQYLSTGACSGGSYLSIPTAALGRNYVIPSWNDNPAYGAGQPFQAELAGGFFLIISNFDGTTVSITPNGRTASGHVGVASGSGAVGYPNRTQATYSVTLQRGQVYWVKGDGSDDANDLSGSTVISNKPVGVLAGHEDAFIGEAPSNGLLDGRDYMVEQVIPSEYWDSTGYVSIPLVPANPVDETATGYGDVFRTYTNTNGTNIEENDGVISKNDMSTSPYASPPQTRGIGTPMEMHSPNGHKFGVMCYQQRSQGTAEPFPAESMMSIVPMSRWRTSYLFYVPANQLSEALQDYYINLIGEKNDVNNNIVFAHNGGPIAKLSGLTRKGAFIGSIPNHPELAGIRYKLQPGSYYFTNPRTKLDDSVAVDTLLRGSFMVYHYGMRSVDPDFDLGDFCGDDFFFSYALPVGMTVSAGGGNPKVTVDTLCSSWHICVHDSVAIASATLIDDPNGDVYGRPGKVFKNVNFDAVSDPDQTNEIVFEVTGNLATDTMRCFDVIVANPFDTAYAPLYIVDKNGFHIEPVLELHYRAPSLSELLEVPQPSPKLPTYIKIDTLQFGMLRVGNQACSTIVLINSSGKEAKSFYITSAAMQKGSPFKVTSTTPSLPDTLHRGDTLRVQVCFTADTVGFNGGDSAAFRDSVIITSDCFKAPLLTLGKSGTPLITATDWDFGPVTIGTTACHDITVYNKGALPFTLTKQWVLHNTTVFSMAPGSAAVLPYLLKPGQFIKLSFCYSPQNPPGPQDSTTVDWNTDIESPFTHVIKSWSFLKGRPIKPGLIWDRPTELDSVICEDSIVVRVHLINKSNATAQSCSVFFIGPDAAEYTIVGNQRGYSPFNNFAMNPGDTLWVDVLFKADLTKPAAIRYAPRHANLIATWSGTTEPLDSTVLPFTGLVQHAALVFKPPLVDLGFITKGQGESGNVIVTDTGDAPFVVKSSDFPNPPIDSVSMNGKVLQPGDTIPRGATVILHINVHLDSYIDTTVGYTLFSDHSCGNFTDSLRVASSSLLVTGTGFPAPDVFVGCREHDSSLYFTNKGSYAITLDSIDLSGVNPPGQFDLIDSKGARAQSLTLGKKLKQFQSDTVGIVYHPTISGPASGTIRFVYDSAGIKKSITTQATGNGVHLQTTLSAAQPSGQPYTADVGAPITVPISLATKALPPNADARRVTFTLTYSQDVVDYSQSLTAPASGNYKFTTPTAVGSGAPQANSVGGGNEALDFDISTNAADTITNLGAIVNVSYQVMVAKDLVSPFVISNVTFYDSKNNVICYIATDTIPSAFIPVYLCGDTTLNQFLHGIFPTRIAKLSPSVLNADQTPVLYYSINRSDLPVKVDLYNVLGKLIRTLQNTPSQIAGDYKLPIGTLGLASGSYTVRLTTPISSESANFILQK